MKKWRVRIIVVLIAVGCFAAAYAVVRGANMGFSSPSSKGAGRVEVLSAPVGPEGRLMSGAEFQTWLKKKGYYKGPIDGKAGRLTQEAWDRAYCDQCAVEDMKVALGGE